MGDDCGRGATVDEVIDKAPDRDQRFGLRLESGAGGQWRQPAQPPGALRQICYGVLQSGRVAALEAVGEDDDGRAAGIAAEPRHGQERLQGVADAGAAVPVADQMRGGGKRPISAARIVSDVTPEAMPS